MSPNKIKGWMKQGLKPIYSRLHVYSLMQYIRADVLKSYTSLEEILMKFARVRTFKSKRKLKDVREWTIEDVLEIVQEATETSKKSSAPRNVYDYRQFKAALWSYNAVLDSARMHDTNQTRSLIWASLGYMFDLLSPLQSSPLQYKDILDYLLHIGRIFDDTMSVIAPLELEKPSRHLVAMECCFVDSLALVLQKWIRPYIMLAVLILIN